MDYKIDNLLSPSRLPNETKGQYKARRRIIKLAEGYRAKDGIDNSKTSLIDYVRAITEVVSK